MKVFLKHEDDKILLKNYKSYQEMDHDLLQFSSEEELIRKLGLRLETDEIIIEDNNNNKVVYDFNAERAALSFYEDKKGDEFVSWIYRSGFEIPSNKRRYKLLAFFEDRLNEFNASDISYSEGRRTYNLVDKIKDNLICFKDSSDYVLRTHINKVTKDIEDYLKEDNKYNYARMRRFASVLVQNYDFKLIEPSVKIYEIDEEKQSKVLKDYMAKIHNFAFENKQVRMDELVNEEEIDTIYDEDGIKNDEKEFLEEFKVKKNLHL